MSESSAGAPVERVYETLGRLAILPVVEIDDPALATPLGKALLAEGLPCVEITFRTSGAPAAIAALRRDCPELLVGAGTILSTDQVDLAREAGAAFLVSPGFNPNVARYAIKSGLLILPGVSTPSEIEGAMGHDLRVLKFFPAEAAGGVAFLKAVSPVYPDVRFLPTGGIGPSNLATYLELPAVLACGGSWMVQRKLVANGDFASIRRLAREAVELARAVRGQALSVGGAASGGVA
jgi:Entner-Doudoroff aldolase